nr:hypothetical protein [Tanacetum cinerariifolium]
MNPTAAEQIALDNILVAPEARLTIGKCNSRILFLKPQREATYQITLDALKLSPCYLAFLITTEGMYYCKNVDFVELLWEDFAFQIDNYYSKESMPYPRFTKIIIYHFNSQNKSISMRNRINLHTVRDDSLLGTMKYMSKTKEHQVHGVVIPKEMINEDILNSTAYKTYYTYASAAKDPKKARKFKKSASSKLKTVLVSPKEPIKKPAKKNVPAKKPSKSPARVIIKDTPGVSVSKKKAPTKGKRSKGDGTDFESGVPDKQQYSGDDESNDEDDVKSDANKDKEGSDNEKTNSNEDENLNVNLNDDEEEEHDEEYVRTPDSFEFNDNDEEYDELYKDVKILPKEMSDFATPVIQRTNNELLENVDLTKSSSQPKSSYEAATSLTEFELKKILLDKLEKSKSYRAAEQHRDLYDALVKSYQLDKDLFGSYGSKSKESKSRSSKGSKYQSKSSGKSAQAEKPVFETADTEMPQDQGDDMGNTENQPNVEEASKHDWFKKPERPPTPARDWNARKQIDFRPPHTWISKITKAGKPLTTFDELMSTPIDFSTYVLHNLKIKNLTQEHLVGPAFNILKGKCKSRVELEFYFEDCYKAVIDKLD